MVVALGQAQRWLSAARWLVLGLLLAGCDSAPVVPDCDRLCEQLDACKLLPSVLGSSGDAVDKDVTAKENCIARCLGSDEDARIRVTHCSLERPASFDWCDTGELVCRPLSLCLTRQFPDLPVTGRVTLTISARSIDSTPTSGHCYCDPDPSGGSLCPMRDADASAGSGGGSSAGTGGGPSAGAGGDSGMDPSPLCRLVAKGAVVKHTPLLPCDALPSVTFADMPPGAYDVGIERVQASICAASTRNVVLFAGGTKEVVSLADFGAAAVREKPCEICDDQLNNDENPGIDCEDPKCAVECSAQMEE